MFKSADHLRISSHSDNNLCILKNYYFYVMRRLLLTNYFILYFNKSLNTLSITN